MAGVKLEKVTKIFDGSNVKAVNEADLEIRDREFTVLVGPSGCGKTTTLRMIAGLEIPTSGDIYIGERHVNEVPPKDRDIAMVFQNYALYPHMTAYENMAFGLKLRKVPKPEIDRRVKEAAEILGIGDLLKRKPRALSGGQRQRVALGRAIVREPQVFLMDEPLSNLDAKLRVLMRAELSHLHKRLQTTIVYVTHDQIEAMTMGDRIVVMKDGLIQQVGAPLEIYEKPQNLFVASFIGSLPINLIPVQVIAEGDDFIADAGYFKVTLPVSRRTECASIAGRKAVLGMRPERVQICRDGGTECADAFEAVVDFVEMIGAESNVYLKAGEQALTLKISSHDAVKAGQEMKLYFPPEMLHLFDAETEEALF